ncbi:MAG: polysaccharide deacetylase family protein [Candidatus Riflebacteria bacterium]|nr:polysaccharide deacetylase family protein [Candidatus Riflebacteria bacterium]
MTRSIPVLYYHRIGSPDPAYLSTPVAAFARQMEFLTRHGVRTITVSELVDHLSGTARIRDRAVMITFDDGFRDNLLSALPVLKSNNLHAVLFAVSGLMRPASTPGAETPRDFNSAHTAARRGDLSDFLSFDELKTMVDSGVFEVHSHGHSHEQVFVSNRVTGLFPASDNHWGILSAYRHTLSEGVWPVFERKPGLTRKAMRPDTEKIRGIMNLLSQADLRLLRESPAAFSDRFKGLFEAETEDAFLARIQDDLSLSLEVFRRFHPPGCDSFCMPWGADCPELQVMLRKTGYNAAFLTRSGANLPGDDPYRIRRFPVKRASMARFALGIILRSSPSLARVYGLLHGRL